MDSPRNARRRKRKTPNRTLSTPEDSPLVVRLSADEKRELRKRAKATGETLSAYVMRATLGTR